VVVLPKINICRSILQNSEEGVQVSIRVRKTDLNGLSGPLSAFSDNGTGHRHLKNKRRRALIALETGYLGERTL